MSNPLISIIVPIYNVDQYLNQCIDSIVNQTYTNIEVILVDDGSTDNSSNICDEYALKDSRIKVFHKENSGVSSTRNKGLELSNGDFILFVDSDDYLDLDTLKLLLNILDKEQVIDCVMFSYAKELGDKFLVTHIFDHTQAFYNDDAKKLYRRLFGLIKSELEYPERMENLSSCCMKLYKKEYVKNIKFIDIDEIGSCEDGLFNMHAMYNMNRIYYLDEPLYHYRRSNNSATWTYRSNLVNQWNNLFSIMHSIIEGKQLSQECNEALSNRIALSITAIGLNELHNGFISFMHVMRKYIRTDQYKDAISKLDISYMPITWRILMYCAKYKLTFMLYIGLRIVNILRK